MVISLMALWKLLNSYPEQEITKNKINLNEEKMKYSQILPANIEISRRSIKIYFLISVFLTLYVIFV